MVPHFCVIPLGLSTLERFDLGRLFEDPLNYSKFNHHH